ncbi:phosphonate C-P lyase system protein PhnG [Oryzibacter oryziterrae]|uniref:phosphonate C-P lyase system protein PhnG n=1 Tax=Oryzibacter oryziterrae TaxID=2766474 RepID=UPI001F011B96|nr:phosphonate C-P lyase system protein PhnG [Oryzibacter oryziterrae]
MTAIEAASADLSSAQHERARRLALLARASRDELEAAWAALPVQPSVTALRGPETGLVMLRGRMGGDGAPFNLGEATVSRASVRLGDGSVGHGQRLGGDRQAARLSAIFDALAEGGDRVAVDALCAAIAARVEADAAREAAETAATRVNFFTLVRGED